MKHEITKAPYTETRVINVRTLDNTETLLGLRLTMFRYVSMCWRRRYRCYVNTPFKSAHRSGVGRRHEVREARNWHGMLDRSMFETLAAWNWSEIYQSTSILTSSERSMVRRNDRVNCICDYCSIWRLEWVRAYHLLPTEILTVLSQCTLGYIMLLRHKTSHWNWVSNTSRDR